MSPTFLLVALSAVGIAVFVYGVLMMSRRQEGGSARAPALLMIAGLAFLALAMVSALVLKWTETTSTQPHFEVPGVGDTVLPPAALSPAAPPAAVAPAPTQATPPPAH